VANEDYYELTETLGELSNYYSDTIGRDIRMGSDIDGDVWLSSNRTNGKEYFDSIEEAERRVKLLYNDLLPDEDEIDPLEGF
jgi:hypothetical protein